MKNNKITIVDSIMGSGKTSMAINLMNETDINEANFIYITPFLSEVKRVKENVANRKFYEPTNKNEKGSKLQGFKDLLIKSKDIVSTHALFSAVDEEVYELIQNNNYILILDEVMNVIETKRISTNDFEMLINNKIIEIVDNKIVWLNKEYIGKFDDIKLLAQNDNLYIHTRSSSNKNITLLVWTFPVKIFESFKETYILTYLFNGQIQKYYYDMFNVGYEYKSVRMVDGKFSLVDYIDPKYENREDIKNLINIYEGKLNAIGDDNFALSSTWLKNPKNKKQLEQLKNNIYNYFQNIIKAKSKEIMWTTLMGETNDDSSSAKVKTLLSGKGYSSKSCFVACNCRATNDYCDKSTCAYVLNRFLNPLDKGFFEDKGIMINENLWSLSELLQWIWRSRIRRNEQINLYIPSERMRSLLYLYLENKI